MTDSMPNLPYKIVDIIARFAQLAFMRTCQKYNLAIDDFNKIAVAFPTYLYFPSVYGDKSIRWISPSSLACRFGHDAISVNGRVQVLNMIYALFVRMRSQANISIISSSLLYPYVVKNGICVMQTDVYTCAEVIRRCEYHLDKIDSIYVFSR